MTSKRNSRVFDNGGSHRDCTQSTMPTPYVSRRSSRAELRDDAAGAVAEDGKDEKWHMAWDTKDDFAASALRSANATVAAEQDVSKANGDKQTGEIIDVATSSIRELTICHLVTIEATVSISTRSPHFPRPPGNDRIANFGLVVPGVYRSSYPLAEHFSFCQTLGLKTVV